MAEKTARSRAEVTTKLSPVAAGAASLVVPGLGQVLVGQVYRGILLLIAIGSALGIFWWRVADLGRRVEGFGAKLGKAFQFEPSFMVLVLIFLAIMWLLIAFDAFISVKRGRRGGSGVFLAVLASFFVLGWQISEIDVVRMVREAPDALPPLTKVLWPWKAAIEYETEEQGQDALTAGVKGRTEIVLQPALGIL